MDFPRKARAKLRNFPISFQILIPWNVLSKGKWIFWRHQRYIVALLAFCGFFNVYSLRVNLSVAIVQMTSPVVSENGTIIQPAEFNWDSQTQGLILSSFFYGYICTQILGGWLSTRFGGAKVYGLGIGCTALLTLLMPLAVRWSTSFLLLIRIVQGLCEGVTYPSMHAIWAKWAPSAERAFLVSLAASGSYVGTFVALPLSGYLAYQFDWPSVFYVTGTLGLLWLVVWWYFVYDEPEANPWISEEELNNLKKELDHSCSKAMAYPWIKLIKSLPVWAIVVAHFSENWGFYTLLTQLPTYMKETLHFDIEKAGLLSAVPYLVLSIVLQFSGRLSDWICNRKYLSTTAVRKIFNFSAFMSQMIFLLLVPYAASATGTIIYLVLAVGLGGLSTYSVNILDIAPQYAGVIMGISNTFAALPGIVSPLLTGVLVPTGANEEWKLVFIISSGVFFIGAIFFAVFASAERQPWAMADNNNVNSSDLTQFSYTNAAITTE